jgi:hypothetical protein
LSRNIPPNSTSFIKTQPLYIGKVSSQKKPTNNSRISPMRCPTTDRIHHKYYLTLVMWLVLIPPRSHNRDTRYRHRYFATAFRYGMSGTRVQFTRHPMQFFVRISLCVQKIFLDFGHLGERFENLSYKKNGYICIVTNEA